MKPSLQRRIDRRINTLWKRLEKDQDDFLRLDGKFRSFERNEGDFSITFIDKVGNNVRSWTATIRVVDDGEEYLRVINSNKEDTGWYQSEHVT